jgi:acid phosphatase
MKAVAASALLALVAAVEAHPAHRAHPKARDVDTRYPYTGPAIPVGDWLDQTVNGNGKGYKRIVEPPAVKPKSSRPTNNVNVISTSFVPGGMNIHFQTPFGLGKAPTVFWGSSTSSLKNVATGRSTT